MIFTDNDTEKQVSLVLQALAAGTMIYVAFFEVIARERSKSVNKLLQLVAIVFGYGVMLTLDTLRNLPFQLQFFFVVNIFFKKILQFIYFS